MMKIALMPNLTRLHGAEVTKKLCKKLTELELDWYCPEEISDIIPDEDKLRIQNQDNLFSDADIIIAVGGDGSVIRAVKQAIKTGAKILGVNAGNLAYLCELDADELSLLTKLKNGDYRIQNRMMLDVSVCDGSKEIYCSTGINDIVFRRDANANLIGLDVKANGMEIADYCADGIIFATPTGSSAYSLSAGGAIIEPTVDAALVTPICPHSLIVKPYVFNSSTVFTVTPDSGNLHTVLSVDGESPVQISENNIVTIKKSAATADFISLKSNLFIDVLNKKLG